MDSTRRNKRAQNRLDKPKATLRYLRRAHFCAAPPDREQSGGAVGAEATLRGKRKGLLFLRFFAEYHYVPDTSWAAEEYSLTGYNGQKYTSRFNGADINFSFFSLGLGTGLCF